jgi:hypothetical protein
MNYSNKGPSSIAHGSTEYIYMCMNNLLLSTLVALSYILFLYFAMILYFLSSTTYDIQYNGYNVGHEFFVMEHLQHTLIIFIENPKFQSKFNLIMLIQG